MTAEDRRRLGLLRATMVLALAASCSEQIDGGHTTPSWSGEAAWRFFERF